MGRVIVLGLALLSVAQDNGQRTTDNGQVTIRLKEAGRGDVRLCEVSSNTEITSKLVGPEGSILQEKTLRNAQQSVYRETVLDMAAAGQKLPARLRREYDKALVWIEGKPQVLPHQGKAVLIENKAGQCNFRLEGGAPMTGLAAALLSREMKKGDLRALLLPRQAVRAGDAWKIDMTPVARLWERAIGLQLDSTRATGTGRLTRVYRQGGTHGRLFGVLTIHLEVPITSVGERKHPADPGSRLLTDISLDCCIDGSVSSGTLQATFQVSASAVTPGPEGKPARLLFSTRGALRETRTELPRR